MDARTLKTGITIENKIDWSRNSCFAFWRLHKARRDSNRASFSSSDLGDVTRNDLQRRFLAEHSFSNVGTMLQLFETMLQRCVALKIVVANRPV